MVYTEARLDALFTALSSSVRRDLLDRVAQRPQGVREVAQHYRMSAPAIAKHLRILEAAGLVRRTVEGRKHWITVEQAPLREAADWMRDRQAFWSSRLLSLNRFMASRGLASRKKTRA